MASDGSGVNPTKSGAVGCINQCQREWRRYNCTACDSDFYDLTDTIFTHHHHSLRKWILRLYLIGLNLSNGQIAQKLGMERRRKHR
jgi:transposase-like protein